MDPVLMMGLIFFGLLAGVLGTLFGLGGGIVLVPVLTIVYGLSATEAAAVSLVGIIAGSAGGASAAVRKRSSNIKLGLLLEIPTSVGAIAGAVLAMYLNDVLLLILFAAVMVFGGYRMMVSGERPAEGGDTAGRYSFAFYDNNTGSMVRYGVRNVASGSAACGFAGAMSSMTGVGGGMIKVPVMNMHMGMPMKAATATSTYLVGITAFSGAVAYFVGGQILFDHAAAVAIGGFAGSLIGYRISAFFDGAALKRYFAVVAFAMAASVLLRAGGML